MTERTRLRPPRLATLAAGALMAGGSLWAMAMGGLHAAPVAGVICGLHRAAAPGLHCGWCYLAAGLVAAGVVGLLAAAGQMQRQ